MVGRWSQSKGAKELSLYPNLVLETMSGRSAMISYNPTDRTPICFACFGCVVNYLPLTPQEPITKIKVNKPWASCSVACVRESADLSCRDWSVQRSQTLQPLRWCERWGNNESVSGLFGGMNAKQPHFTSSDQPKGIERRVIDQRCVFHAQQWAWLMRTHWLIKCLLRSGVVCKLHVHAHA